MNDAHNPLGHATEHTILISCIFGELFKHVHSAIPGLKCIFFSNNYELNDEIRNKGWDFKFVNTFPLSSDYRISSMQAKYIKFLQFFNEFPEYKKAERIIYFDHKLNVSREHIDFINSVFAEEKSILIRNTPRLKTSIKDEIDDAAGIERYATAMTRTLKWIDLQIKERRLTLDNRVMHTGIIAYKNTERISPLLDEIYDTVWELGQPECQIIFALLSQGYESVIQRIEAHDLNIFRETPVY